MKRVIELARITVKQAIKERSFYVILIATLLAVLAVPVLYSFTMFEVPRVLAGFALSYTNFAVLILMLFLVMNLSQTDLDRKTLQYVISLPIRRRDYVFGRFLGFVFFACILIFFILAITVPFVALFSRMRPDAPFYIGYYFLYGVFLLIEVALLVAIALLFLSLTSRTIVSMFGVAGCYIVGHTMDEVAEFLRTGTGMNMPVFSKAVIQVVRYIFPNLALFDVKTAFIYGKGMDGMSLFLSLLYGVLYTVIVLLLAVVLFEKKEVY
ncbi:MAG TPA: ABC transporter permease subunit [Candidatus Hydrothermia bacterium]|nr:ABC transporter permease subunit [Candidatus Hydrothermia bacterium]